MLGGGGLPVNPAVRRPGRLGLLGFLAVIAVGSLAVGLVGAVGTQVTNGPVETGAGAYVTEHPLTYWEWVETALGTVPAAVPGRASTTVGAPTVLGLEAASYAIDPAVSGQPSVIWTFAETPATPARTELALTFVDGLADPATTVTVYLETAVRAPFLTLEFVFYWDAGAFAPTALDIETMSATVVACPAIGDCA